MTALVDGLALLSWLSSRVTPSSLAITALALLAWCAWCDHRGRVL